MYKHHNYEERLNIVSRILCGETINSICRELQLDWHMVVQWHLRYKKYGEEGLRGTRSYHYSSAEKCRFTNEVQNHSLTPWGKRSRKEGKVV